MSRLSRYARDAENPHAGEVYETKAGFRWEVVGRNAKGRAIMRRAGHRSTQDLQWTPEMLAKLTLVRRAEAVDVERQLGLFDRLMGRDELHAQKRRFFLHVTERIVGRRREFSIRVSPVRPGAEKHDCGCHACASSAVKARTDLTKRIPPLYGRKEAADAARFLTRVLRKRGLTVRSL